MCFCPILVTLDRTQRNVFRVEMREEKTETASVFPFVIGRMRRTQRNVFPVGDMHLREKGKGKNEDVETFFFF